METPSRRSLRGIAALALAALVSGSAVSAAGAAGAAPSRPSTAVPSEVRAIFQKPMYAKGVWGLRVLDGKNVLARLQLAAAVLYRLGAQGLQRRPTPQCGRTGSHLRYAGLSHRHGRRHRSACTAI